MIIIKWLFAVIFLFIGSFLFALTIEEIGVVSLATQFAIGVGCIYIAGSIVKEKEKSE